MASHFGFLLPPLPPLVPPDLPVQTISPSQLAYSFPASSIGSTIAIFLLPGQTLPPGSAAALYIQFPPGAADTNGRPAPSQQQQQQQQHGQGEFRFLGALGEGKASAMFRVAGLKGGGGSGGDGDRSGATYGGEVDMDADEQPAGAGAAEGTVTIGVSLEPAAEVAAKVAAQRAQRGDGVESPMTALVRRNAAAAAAATTTTAATAAAGPPGTKVLAQRIIKNAFNFLASFEGGTGMVPIKAFEGWWQKFERRIENDPGFLERDQD